MRLDAAPVPVAGADVNVGLVLVEDEPPVEVLLEDEPPVEWLVPLPDDGACEADAVLVGVDDLVGGAVVVVFVVCGVGLLTVVLGAVSEPADTVL